MIDIHEPVRKSYSESEKVEIRQNFLLLAHSFLLLYLTTHNVLVPVVMNLFKGRNLLIDVHYWFLAYVPFYLWLKQKKSFPSFYLPFVFCGSLARIVFYNIILFSHSWLYLSVMLSEISALIFCFIAWDHSPRYFFKPVIILGMIVPVLLYKIEMRMPVQEKVYVRPEMTDENYENYGCEGSLVRLSFPLVSKSPVTTSKIQKCGLEKNLLTVDSNFVLINGYGHDINLRLYKLIWREGRFTWKFVKMQRIEHQGSWNLDPNIKNAGLYLIKAPEIRNFRSCLSDCA